jgi:hypothetical protein
MKYILFILLPFSIYAQELFKGGGSKPEGNHCLAYVFTQIAREKNLSLEYQSPQNWINWISKDAPAKKVKSFQVWEEKTGHQIITLIEPRHPSIALPENQILLWVGDMHPQLKPAGTPKEWTHAAILIIKDGKPILKHYGKDNKPFYIEKTRWSKFEKQTQAIYKIL